MVNLAAFADRELLTNRLPVKYLIPVLHNESLFFIRHAGNITPIYVSGKRGREGTAGILLAP